jgi:hypothetical protein
MPGMNRERFHANFTPIFHNERNLGSALIGCQTFRQNRLTLSRNSLHWSTAILAVGPVGILPADCISATARQDAWLPHRLEAYAPTGASARSRPARIRFDGAAQQAQIPDFGAPFSAPADL